MFDNIKDIAKDLGQDMIRESRDKQLAIQMGRVNFVMEKTLPDGLKVSANSFNPVLLLKMFKEFVKEASK